jgi:hypothetical protein
MRFLHDVHKTNAYRAGFKVITAVEVKVWSCRLLRRAACGCRLIKVPKEHAALYLDVH